MVCLREPTTGKAKLQFNEAASRMNVDEDVLMVGLEFSEPNEMGFRHAVLDGDEGYRNHAALLPDRVGAHFHAAGLERYQVFSGPGRLYWGRAVANGDGSYRIEQETPVDVRTGDSFIIPEGYAHQLVNTGDKPLIFAFGCPDSHLNDEQDRVKLPDLAPANLP